MGKLLEENNINEGTEPTKRSENEDVGRRKEHEGEENNGEGRGLNKSSVFVRS